MKKIGIIALLSLSIAAGSVEPSSANPHSTDEQRTQQLPFFLPFDPNFPDIQTESQENSTLSYNSDIDQTPVSQVPKGIDHSRYLRVQQKRYTMKKEWQNICPDNEDFSLSGSANTICYTEDKTLPKPKTKGASSKYVTFNPAIHVVYFFIERIKQKDAFSAPSSDDDSEEDSPLVPISQKEIDNAFTPIKDTNLSMRKPPSTTPSALEQYQDLTQSFLQEYSNTGTDSPAAMRESQTEQLSQPHTTPSIVHEVPTQPFPVTNKKNSTSRFIAPTRLKEIATQIGLKLKK